MQRQHLIALLIANLALTACNTMVKTDSVQPKTNVAMSQTSDPSSTKQVKDHISVALYTGKQKPNKPYVVLGQETVSKYNLVGIKRQEANIHDAMRQLAATLGGDAVIDIATHQDNITGTVISYTKQPVQNSAKNKA